MSDEQFMTPDDHEIKRLEALTRTQAERITYLDGRVKRDLDALVKVGKEKAELTDEIERLKAQLRGAKKHLRDSDKGNVGLNKLNALILLQMNAHFDNLTLATDALKVAEKYFKEHYQFNVRFSEVDKDQLIINRRYQEALDGCTTALTAIEKGQTDDN